MDQPVISVVMPMRNASRFLNESIASIRTQSFANLEFLILDDASTDDSLVIAGLHARVDPRIRILPLSPSGVAGALNQGISAARGRFIARMDADDVALPDRLAQQL